MGNVASHYRDLLAADYLTMIGDFDARVRSICGLHLSPREERASTLGRLRLFLEAVSTSGSNMWAFSPGRPAMFVPALT